MTNKNILPGMLVLVFGLTIVISCEPDAKVNDEPANPYIGTWDGTYYGKAATLVCESSTWTLDVPEHELKKMSGTYTYVLYPWISATFNQTSPDDVILGTGVISGNTMTLKDGLVQEEKFKKK